MSANDRDTIRIDGFLHFYRLRQSKIPGNWEFKPWVRNSRFILDSSSSLHNWKMSFFFVSSEGWETVPGENSNDAPRLLCSWGTLVFCSSFYYLCIRIFLHWHDSPCVFNSSYVFLCNFYSSSSKEAIS